MEKAVGIAVSGLGEISQLHIKGILRSKHGKLIGVFSHSHERAREIARMYGIKAYSSYEELCRDNDVDAVIIASKDEDHLPQTVEAAKAGKHVLVEKPPALTVTDVEFMNKICKENNVICMPVHNYIYTPQMMRLKDIIMRGDLGKPLYAFASVFHKISEENARKYHGTLITQAYHLVYSLLFLFGDAEYVTGYLDNVSYKEYKNIDDLAIVILKFKNGVVGHILSGWCCDDLTPTSWTWMVKVFLEKGVFTFNSMETLSYSQSASYYQSRTIDFQESFFNIVSYFIDNVIINKEPPLSTMEDAIKTFKILESIKSHKIDIVRI
ncbi:MAG: Gfo/Idh/MocA family protein [Vulcanisaeta sp.]|uniref:Gfo/Idh/MocA family protein n=1 Tax=Vulcanisaeta sp. TaxID=2020871 RepID=UPI003D10161B